MIISPSEEVKETITQLSPAVTSVPEELRSDVVKHVSEEQLIADLLNQEVADESNHDAILTIQTADIDVPRLEPVMPRASTVALSEVSKISEESSTTDDSEGLLQLPAVNDAIENFDPAPFIVAEQASEPGSTEYSPSHYFSEEGEHVTEIYGEASPLEAPQSMMLQLLAAERQIEVHNPAASEFPEAETTEQPIPKIASELAHKLVSLSVEQQESITSALTEVVAILQVIASIENIEAHEQPAQYLERVQRVLRQVLEELEIEASETEVAELFNYLIIRTSAVMRAQSPQETLDLGTHERKHQSAFINSAIFVEEHLHQLLGMLAVAPHKVSFAA